MLTVRKQALGLRFCAEFVGGVAVSFEEWAYCLVGIPPIWPGRGPGYQQATTLRSSALAR